MAGSLSATRARGGGFQAACGAAENEWGKGRRRAGFVFFRLPEKTAPAALKKRGVWLYCRPFAAGRILTESTRR
jgi:hypothetical protein